MYICVLEFTYEIVGKNRKSFAKLKTVAPLNTAIKLSNRAVQAISFFPVNTHTSMIGDKM